VRVSQETSEQRFEVLDGTIKFTVGRKTIVAKAGDVVTVPAGKRHSVENAGVRPAHFEVTLTPRR
jgi:mannose-6-phosphate isomerase-like protein (cupin superfamily)